MIQLYDFVFIKLGFFIYLFIFFLVVEFVKYDSDMACNGLIIFLRTDY